MTQEKTENQELTDGKVRVFLVKRSAGLRGGGLGHPRNGDWEKKNKRRQSGGGGRVWSHPKISKKSKENVCEGVSNRPEGGRGARTGWWKSQKKKGKLI